MWTLLSTLCKIRGNSRIKFPPKIDHKSTNFRHCRGPQTTTNRPEIDRQPDPQTTPKRPPNDPQTTPKRPQNDLKTTTKRPQNDHFGRFVVVLRSFGGRLRVVWGLFLGRLPVVSWSFSGPFLVVFWSFFGRARGPPNTSQQFTADSSPNTCGYVVAHRQPRSA